MRGYSEHRGVLVEKYRSVFGAYVFVLDENGHSVKVNVGKGIYFMTKHGVELIVGRIGRRLINIRPCPSKK